MRIVSRNTHYLTRATAALCFLLLLLSSLAPARSLAATTLAAGRVRQAPAALLAAVPNGTYQDFDRPNTGTPYAGTHVQPPVLRPIVTDGGPADDGQMLRLAFGTLLPNDNSITFERTVPGPFDQIVADFDFRITPGTGRADGLGFALLNIDPYGTTGETASTDVAEEPHFTRSLGVGFDVYRSSLTNHVEVNDNHISIHFDNERVGEFDVGPAIDLAGSQWIHARIIMRPGGGYSDVTVILAQCGKPPVKVVDQLPVPGFVPYEGRARFAARSGGLTANYDIDNIHLQPLGLAQSLVSFQTGCASVVETEGMAEIVVSRVGATQSSVTVNYATTPSSALQDSDYTAATGTLALTDSAIITVPIVDDALDESDERFLISLSDPSGNAVIGGPATAKVVIIDDESSRRAGHWSPLISARAVPIHMHMLPTGKVLYWDRHDDQAGWEGNPRLWDPATEMLSATQVPTVTYDIFCSGHVFLENGDLLVAGGHITGTIGENKASIYHPFTNTWTTLPEMNGGRWYPSNLALPNGDVLVMGGTDEIGLNLVPQVWETVSGRWRDLSDAPLGLSKTDYYPAYPDYYPFLYVAPNGKVFNAGPQWISRYLDPSGTGSWTNLAGSLLGYRDYGSSVMYGAGKIMIVGGNPRDPKVDQAPTVPPSAGAEVIDLNNATPAWRSVVPMHFPRRHLNTTLLPDGKVLVTGGSGLSGFDNPAGAVLKAELWDPATEQWTLMAAQKRYRGYHSSALLLPDGRVLVGGGGHPGASTQDNFEIFSPPYLFKGDRPAITSAPAKAGYEQPFFVTTPHTSTISRVTLVRLSSVTHGYNQNQRINDLPFTRSADGLTITTPESPNLAPPGHYMLFLLNDQGVPSIAHSIRLGLTVANDDSYTMFMKPELSVPAGGLLDNDRSVQGSLTISHTDPMSGSLLLNDDGSFTYTPQNGYYGEDRFTYTIDDGHGRQDTATVRILILHSRHLALIAR